MTILKTTTTSNPKTSSSTGWKKYRKAIATIGTIALAFQSKGITAKFPESTLTTITKDNWCRPVDPNAYLRAQVITSKSLKYLLSKSDENNKYYDSLHCFNIEPLTNTETKLWCNKDGKLVSEFLVTCLGEKKQSVNLKTIHPKNIYDDEDFQFL